MDSTDTFLYGQANDVQKNDLLLINDHPCKIVDRSTSKTGKHGGCKISFAGIDIFTGNKYCTIYRSDDKIKIPNILRNHYKIVDIEKDGDEYLFHLIDNNGLLRENIKIDGDNVQDVYEKFIDDHDIDITIMEYLNNVIIVTYKLN